VSRLVICLLLASTAGWSAPNITLILGQPTDRSITVSTRSDTALEIHFEYGLKPGVYDRQSRAAVLTADPYAAGFFVSQTVISGLDPDAAYFYRLQWRAAASSGSFTAGQEYSFHTQRRPGSAFVFCVQGDSHPEREKTMFNSSLYSQTLKAVAREQPDFYISSGDDFSVDTLPTPYTSAAVAARYTLQLAYFDLIARSASLFLGTGNHEETSLFNYNLPADEYNSNQVPVWAQNARNLYYPAPAPNDPNTGGFYTGNPTRLPGIGLLRDYYAFEWGDALFVIVDPYWSSPALVDSGPGGQNSTTSKTTDKWTITHGGPQYQWLKQTLEQTKARWKFVFAHHVMGTGRGGVEIADQFEWGGNNNNGTWGFAANRPTWPLPVHQLMAANHVTIFFQAHDHLFARQELDGVVYQSLPNPADNTYTAFNADAYTSGDVFPNSGYTKVTVGPASVRVEYIREWLPLDEKPPTQVSGMVQFAYTVAAGALSPAISRVNSSAGGSTAIAPNSWVEIKGTSLAPNTRVWQPSDFVNGELPIQLDGVGVTVDGKPALVSYISPSQINVLTSARALPDPVSVQVTSGAAASAPFAVPARPVVPGFFAAGNGLYVAATHAGGAAIDASSPARPGETIVLYGAGFGGATLLSPAPAIQIGGACATVQFAGLVAPGLYQFNVVVPPGLSAGDQPVVANFGGQSTQNGVLIPIQP
jgi:uncharacterized protein (TIGR03437 family)